MNKPKAQTLQQKMGFFDEDLKKPKHDEIMLWLDTNIEEIINKLFNKPFSADEISSIKVAESVKIQSILNQLDKDISLSEIALNSYDYEKDGGKSISSVYRQRTKEEEIKHLEELKRKKELLEKFDINDPKIFVKPRIKKIAKKWELPVSTGNSNNKYTIGFIDFSASFNVPYLELLGLRYSTKTLNSYDRTYYDFYEEDIKFSYIAHERTIFVEVKSEINSLGELIRQINHYKSYLPGDYYVLCPDNKYKETLKEQGIKTIDFEL